MEIRGAKKRELKKIIELINYVFRTGRGNLPHTMEIEFPLLLTETNINNIKIIKDNGKIISIISFLPKTIFIEGIPITTGSIGAVCTHPDYRGKGYSSLLLLEVEKSMKKMGIALCLISSNRNLYKKWGASEVKGYLEYEILPLKSKTKINFNVREYKKNDLSSIEKIYNEDSTRYYRSHSDFKKLIISGTFPFGETEYKKYVFESRSSIKGYIILKLTPSRVEVKEAGGNDTDIFSVLSFLAKKLNVGSIQYSLSKYKVVPSDYNQTKINLKGTLKIIDKKLFIKQLQPYYINYMEQKIMDNLMEKVLNANSSKMLLDLIFPIPFPWTENLNYQ